MKIYGIIVCMINIDFLTIKAFINENLDFFINARLQKIQQPSRRELILSLRNNSESRRFYININPQIYHIAFINKETEVARNIVIPKQPPMFCMLLRKYLEGCKIVDAYAIENERILNFCFEIYDELSQKQELCLSIELMGKHSNVILYNRESEIILGCAHNVGAEKSRYRELHGGIKYVLPPSNAGLSNELKLQFKGLSAQKIEEYLSSETYSPAILEDKYTLFKELLPNSLVVNSVNEMLDLYYSKYQADLILNQEKDKLYAIVKTRFKKVNSSIEKISSLIKKRNNIAKYKLFGELLTANLYLKKDYVKLIELFDYNYNQKVLIELDETKTLNENAQNYFRLYNKSKTTLEKSKQMLEGLKIELDYLKNIEYSIKIANLLSELDEINKELVPESFEKKANTSKQSEIMKINVKGFDVYVGKNNKQNDIIVSKLSKDEDYWFHTRLCAGSHVLLKIQDKEPDEEILFECCKLAKQYSSATQPSKVGVIYTKRKFIKKPPHAPLGYVIYKNEKEVLI